MSERERKCGGEGGMVGRQRRLKRMTYRETGPKTEVFVNWRAVEAFEIRERPVVGLVDQGCVVVDVF